MKIKALRTLLSRSILILLVWLLLAGCSGFLAPAPTETPAPTSTATATAEPTATATNTATLTPEPTATQTASPTPNVTSTAIAAATAAVDAFLEEIAHDLDHYELTLESGHLVYSLNDSVVLNMKSYAEEKWQPFEDAPVVGDFLMQSDITWDSSSGLAGCGLIFRADEDLQEGEQYQFYMMRLQNAPGWEVDYFRYGKAQYPLTLDQRFQFTNIVHDGKKSTNRVAIQAKGDQITVFINGKGMRPLTNNKLTSGIIGMIGWQESGTSFCKFENTWVWSFDEP